MTDPYLGLRDIVGTCYLLHFDRPFGHARHYLGWSGPGYLEERLAEHAAGTGGRLLHHVRAAGIGWTLVRTWEGTRHRERALKLRADTAASARRAIPPSRPSWPVPFRAPSRWWVASIRTCAWPDCVSRFPTDQGPSTPGWKVFLSPAARILLCPFHSDLGHAPLVGRVLQHGPARFECSCTDWWSGRIESWAAGLREWHDHIRKVLADEPFRSVFDLPRAK